MLCPYVPIFALADKQSRGVYYSPPLQLRFDPLLPHTSPQMSGYVASPYSSQLPLSAPSASPHVTVSMPLAGHPCLDSKPINTSPRAPEATRKLAVPGHGGPVVELNGGGLHPEEKDEEGAEALPCFEHMVSPVILKPVGHL